jgi:hypothetical protein
MFKSRAEIEKPTCVATTLSFFNPNYASKKYTCPFGAILKPHFARLLTRPLISY